MASPRYRATVLAFSIGGALALGCSAAAFAADPEINFGRVDMAQPRSPSLEPASTIARGDARKPDDKKADDPAATPKPDTRLHPYVGLQAGGSGSTLQGLAPPNPVGVTSTSDPERHVRAQAGVDYPLTPKVDLGFGYR